MCKHEDRGSVLKSSNKRMKSYTRMRLFSHRRSSTANWIIIQFVDDYKNDYGIEPIYREMMIAPSNYYRTKDLESYSEKRSLRS